MPMLFGLLAFFSLEVEEENIWLIEMEDDAGMQVSFESVASSAKFCCRC
jgi:hypothetical protein